MSPEVKILRNALEQISKFSPSTPSLGDYSYRFLQQRARASLKEADKVRDGESADVQEYWRG